MADQGRDLEEFLRRMRAMSGRGPGPYPGLASSLLIVLLAGALSFLLFTFRVHPDEQGLVLRFGKLDRIVGPGLHLRFPPLVEEVHLPKVTRQNIIEVGSRLGGNSSAGERLMVTGDENVVAVNFVAFWRIKDAQKYLFNIQNPELSVNDVAESAMREVVGRSELKSLLTQGRLEAEQAVHRIMQGLMESYDAGIRIDGVQLQRLDPPAQVIDASRDVQAARTDKERLQNEADAYASRVVAEARGEAERVLQGARAHREQTVAEADGQTARVLKVYEEYRAAPDVTRKRMYLETIERVLGGANKIIMNSKSAVPQVAPGQR